MNTTSVSQTADKSAFLERIFPFLVQRGLENVSIRELCKGTGIVQGSLYYWFGDKTNIVCEATEYGLKKVTKEIFEYVLGKTQEVCADFFRLLRSKWNLIKTENC